MSKKTEKKPVMEFYCEDCDISFKSVEYNQSPPSDLTGNWWTFCNCPRCHMVCKTFINVLK